MATTAGQTAYPDRRFARLVERVTALGRHRVLVVVLVVAAIAGALVLDVRFVSYPIAGFYLVPVTLAALTLRVRETIVVALVCLGLAIYIIVVQDRLDGPTITVVCFSALGGAALIALSYLFTQVGQLYETERSTSERLESLAAQLQTLQEVAVLDTERPLSELLGQAIEQAGQLLGSDACCVYRYEPERAELRLAAATGGAGFSPAVPLAQTGDAMVRALREHQPVAVSGHDGGGAQLAVPLLVRNEGYGVLALGYREQREFSDLDVRLAASFGDAGHAWPSRTPACATRSGRPRPPPSARGWRATCTTPSRSRCSPRASRPRPSVAAGSRPPKRRRVNVQDVERLARGALAEMRTLLMEMRPDTLAEASLSTLVEQLAAATGGSSRLDVHLDVRPGAQLPQDVSVALFRIAQESLQNVSRHSGASEAWVMLDMSGPVVRLSVRDDGHGFDEATVTPEHFGLAMHARARGGRRGRRQRRERAGARYDRLRRVAARRRGRMTEGGAVPERGDDKRIKVVIVDDHVLVRSGLEVVLGMFDDIELAGQAGDGEDGRAAVPPSCSPTWCSWTSSCPGMSGVEATRRVLETCPDTKVVALTSFTEEDLIGETLRAGAIGYLMKNVSADQLADAVRAAAAGRSTLAPEAADVLMRSVSAPRPQADSLTAREQQVLKLMADGLTNADIAERLVIGVATVKTHVSSIIAKLDVSTRTEATALAIRRGLV